MNSSRSTLFNIYNICSRNLVFMCVKGSVSYIKMQRYSSKSLPYKHNYTAKPNSM